MKITTTAALLKQIKPTRKYIIDYSVYTLSETEIIEIREDAWSDKVLQLNYSIRNNYGECAMQVVERLPRRMRFANRRNNRSGWVSLTRVLPTVSGRALLAALRKARRIVNSERQ